MKNAYDKILIYAFAAFSLCGGATVAEAQTAARSIAGTYKLDTYKNRQGYFNTLDVTAKGADKLHVALSGSYNYVTNGAETMHDAEGEGDAVLNGDGAIASVKDEHGKMCRVTINFSGAAARVAVPATCQFNVRLSGVYKKDNGKSADENAENHADQTKEISVEQLNDFVNDFDAHKIGERYVIKDVSARQIYKAERADKFGTASYKNLYYLFPADDETNVANGFLASTALVNNWKANNDEQAARLRVTAVLAESRGKFDVYRISFVTKIEGLSDDGAVIWTATGDEPARTKFTH